MRTTIAIIILTATLSFCVFAHFSYYKKEVKEATFERQRVRDLGLMKDNKDNVIDRTIVTDKGVYGNVDSVYYNSLEIGSFINVLTYK